MSTSTDGQICYGIVFPEGFEFPWETYDEEGWWRKVKGYKPPFELYTEDGEYINGVKPEQAQIDAYYEHQRNWEKANPFPVEVVNYCSGDCPMYILAAKGSLLSNSRGYPLEFDPNNMKMGDWQALIEFCETYLLKKIDEYNGEEWNDEKILIKPKWYLTSYWG